jgi:tetratricopeptide (TPR) repeat protein
MGRECLALLLCLSFAAPVAATRIQRGPVAPEVRTIRGKVATDAPHPPGQPIQVILEGPLSQRIDTAVVDGGGNFQFTNVPAGSVVYVVIDLEGFEPFREAVDTGVWFGTNLNVFLRPRTETVNVRATPDPRAGDAPGVVDLGQLQADIPEAVQEEYERALEDSREGDHQEALERLERVVARAPGYYEAQNSLGVQYMELARLPEAEAAFERARAINPSGAAPLINLGSLYLREGDAHTDQGRGEDARASFEKARAIMERAVQLNSQSAVAAYFLGTALYKTAAYAEAEAALRRSLEMDPSAHEPRLILANVYVRLGHLDLALQAANEYLEKSPGGPLRSAAERLRAQIEPLLD